MMDYMEYLEISAEVVAILAGIFLVIQVIGEILEFKGKVVPEFISIRKYFARKKKERETIMQMPESLSKMELLLNDVNKHYATDNIAMRDKWMDTVNTNLEIVKELDKKVDKNSEDITSLLIDNKRSEIIDFASRVSDKNYLATREQFNRIFKIYEGYEDIIRQNGLTNGEVDIAYRIITESYEEHMRNHTFIEDIRGYNSDL